MENFTFKKIMKVIWFLFYNNKFVNYKYSDEWSPFSLNISCMEQI